MTKLVFADKRRVEFDGIKFKQGQELNHEQATAIARAGFKVEELVPQATIEPEVEPEAKPLSELSNKELKTLALAKGYDGKNGLNSDALIAFLEGK
jgi:hypothetical protein